MEVFGQRKTNRFNPMYHMFGTNKINNTEDLFTNMSQLGNNKSNRKSPYLY